MKLLAAAGEQRQRAGHVVAQEARALLVAELRQVVLDGQQRGPRLLDQHRARGSAPERLQRQRAGAGVEIEDREPVAALAESIEQALAHAIGGGPGALSVGRAQRASPRLSTDDAH